MNGVFSAGKKKKKKERTQFQERMIERKKEKKKGCCLNESQSSCQVMVVRRWDGGRAVTSWKPFWRTKKKKIGNLNGKKNKQ
jgi:hypothetical protein